MLALGCFLLTGAGPRADDDEKADPVPDDVRAAIMKIADLLDKGKLEDARKEAAALAKKKKYDGGDPGSCKLLMRAFQYRNKGGFGVGDKPALVKPDGIEKYVMDLDKLSANRLKNEATEIKKIALITAAIGDIALEATPKKDNGKKKAADWKKWSQEMHTYGLELAGAAGKAQPDVKSVKDAAKELDGSCTECHPIFK